MEDKKQRNARERRNYRKNPEPQRRARFRYLYGIELEERDALLEKQRGLCPLCGLVIVGFGMGADQGVVDHDHVSGRVRGILHPLCNRRLGAYELLRGVAESYLAQE